MDTPVIEIKNLVRDYGQSRGVFDVSFQVYKGECFGFLGPNGAGKSTTIRHLMGFSKPDSGQTLINGQDTSKKRDLIMQNVSYIPGEISLPSLLTGKEFIDEMIKLKNVKDTTYLDYLTDLFELDTSLLCKEMSLGMKRKIAIVTAFMSNPDIIIMDEPSSGLDPNMQDIFVELIKQEVKRGKTILMSSHIFSEIDSCCSRIAVIKDGRIVSLFNAEDLKHASLKKYIISFKNEKDMSEFKGKLTKKMKSTKKGKNKLIVEVDDKDINSLIKIISNSPITDFTQIKQTLEDYFMSFYKEDRTYGGV